MMREVPVVDKRGIDIGDATFRRSHHNFVSPTPRIVPHIIQTVNFDKYQPAIMSQGLTDTGDMLVGTLFRWNPETEDRTDHLVIYSSDELFIGRDGNHW